MPDPKQSSAQPSAPDSGEAPEGPTAPAPDDNPFAAPPEGRPDQPWRPRHSDAGPTGPTGPTGPMGPFGPGQPPQQPAPRWDPTDPVQRRARYALLSGMWAFFFTLFHVPAMGLLLGSLAMYWGFSSLRAKPTPPAPGTPTPPVRPQTTPAVAGLLTAALALILTASTYAMQIAYKDFYVCRDDALTKSAALKCNDLLPPPLRDLMGVKP
ncbi:hypothetical protein [Streptomyces sp. NPDC093225]|uniref:hypothetical protein n=1 Tax=Streptomyces sp. NPDC093225 TaxID=3366034 RepID=UPI0038197269